jgi:excinuclease ABC subunit C
MFNLEKVKLLSLPLGPGVYQFYDQSKQIIYIGKAVNLRRRVLSYWQNYCQLTPAKQQLVDSIAHIKWQETGSEIEALLLEASLIKKYQPKYNIVWRDDKRYIYIAISADAFPRVYLTRKLAPSGQFFGPFTSVQAARETLKAIRKIWPYRSCRAMPKRVCLYYQLGQCPGPCQGLISKSAYQKIIHQLSLFLQGKKQLVVKRIQTELDKYTQELNKLKPEDRIVIEQKIISLTWQLQQINKVLATSRVLSLEERYANDVVELGKILGLQKPPRRIEGYDISNLYGAQAVGSLVVFVDGEASPQDYKRFKLGGNSANLGDVPLLREMLRRRLAHDDWFKPDLIIIDGARAQVNAVYNLLKQAGWDVPVIGLAKDRGLRSARALDKVYFPGESKPLQLSLNSPALFLLKRVRNEAHRFAISFHRHIRRKVFWE